MTKILLSSVTTRLWRKKYKWVERQVVRSQEGKFFIKYQGENVEVFYNERGDYYQDAEVERVNRLADYFIKEEMDNQ